MKTYWMAAIIILLGVLAVYTLYRNFRRANPWSRTPYERQEFLLSPAEKIFYDVLRELVGDNIAICPKPSVREILRVREDVKKNRLKYFNWISQKHVDFVLCDQDTMQILCAVELDDRSHERSDRKRRDAFLDKAFRKAKLPLFHIPCRKSYGAKELNELYRFLCQGMLELSDVEEEEDLEEVPICPDCGVPMVLRTASRGLHKGQQFYGCPNFPECRRTREYCRR